MSTLVTTLCVIRDGSRILLGMKKRGFGAGRWNGFGGKVQEGESVEEAAVRETREESGVTPLGCERCGVLKFSFADEPDFRIEMHIFRASAHKGVPAETEEMLPQWFDADALPFDAMWPDDRHWFPLFLAGKNFTGRFRFRGHDEILEQDLREAERGQSLAGDGV